MVSKDHHGYTVTYESSSHWKVITQMWGSVWPRVLPYCLFNVAISALIQWLDAQDGISLAISDKGHSFMNLMVAFLIVSRVNISIGRYNQARGYLSVMYREARELIQNTAVLSGHNTDVRAKQWRNDVAYQTCILLRVAMGVIDYEEEYVNVWELEELDQDEREDIQKFLFLETSSNQNALRWGHAVRTEYEENMRVPIRLAYLLRKLIKTQRTELGDPLVIGFELKLMGSVDSFMGGYYGMRKFLTTPFPFPLVQMARTFLFFYVYTVPFALLSDSSNAVAHCIVIFILTYGFMGLEYVSIELDNPFGEDDNDFDNLGMAYTAFEDTYLSILQVDGPEWTDRLRKRMNPFGNSAGRTGGGETSSLLV